MFLKKRWSLLLLKHLRQTAKFQSVGRLHTLLGLHFNATICNPYQKLRYKSNQIPLPVQSCRQRYRYFTDKNTDRISTRKNKRCILGVFHPSCNAF